MKILLCSAVFSPAWKFGGLVTWAAQAAHELAVRGHEVTVLATSVGAQDAPSWEVLPGGVTVARSPGRIVGGMLWSPALARAAREAAPSVDLIVVSGFWQWPVASICRSAHRAGKAIVLVPHGGLAPWVQSRNRFLKRAYFNLRGAAAVRSASAIQFVSIREANESLGLEIDTRRIVSPPGVDFDFWTPDDRERELARNGAGVGKGKALFVWTGRFHAQKGLDLLPAALAPLGRKDWELVLIGHGHDSETANSLNRAFEDAGLGGKVVFVKGSDSQTVRTLLRAADGFVLPSIYESFGFSAAEAAACDCAIAVSDACDIAAYAAGEGFAVLPREPVMWTDWFRSVIDSVANGRRPAGCRDRLEPVMSTRASWGRTDVLYRDITCGQ